MPATGGGPPRKSHTKSRKGCRTCKNRHIRCDELFPQCRNCAKHMVRCDYMDMPAAGEELMKGSKPPDLLTAPELQKVLDNWRLTGQSPLPELIVNDLKYWTRYSTIDLRLIHHITSLTLDLHRRGYSSCTPWASKMLTLIHVALSSDFVMSAILAFSASQLAWQTKNQDIDNLAYHHRGIALKGLHEAIGAFSEQNSEAILAASILLSWQAMDWRTWASLQHGLLTIMNEISLSFHKSELAIYLEGQQAMARTRAPLATGIPGHLPPTPPDDIRQVDNMVNAIHNLRLRLANHEDLVSHVDTLLTYLRQLQRDFPLQATEDAFERLQPLKALLFWLPSTALQPGTSDLGALAMLAHFYAFALSIEPLFPEVRGAYLGNMAVVPIESIHDMLLARRTTVPQDASIQVALSLLEVPLQTSESYKAQRRQFSSSSDQYRYSPHSPYPVLHSQISPTSETPGASIYTTSPLRSPQGFQLQSPSYFPVVPSSSSTVRRGSGTVRSQSDRTLSTPSSLSNVSYMGQEPVEWKSQANTGRTDYFGSTGYQQPSTQSHEYSGLALQSPSYSDATRINTSKLSPSTVSASNISNITGVSATLPSTTTSVNPNIPYYNPHARWDQEKDQGP